MWIEHDYHGGWVSDQKNVGCLADLQTLALVKVQLLGHPTVLKLDMLGRMIWWYTDIKPYKPYVFEVECRSYGMGLMKGYLLIWWLSDSRCECLWHFLRRWSEWHDAVGPVVGWHEDLGFIGTPERLTIRCWVRLHTWSTQGSCTCLGSVRCLDLQPYDICDHGCPISFQLFVSPLTRPRHLPAFPKP